ncbi:BrnT family toxin [Glaciimonas soli]|nr:hypothetical protein [Glaciimonas soli]
MKVEWHTALQWPDVRNNYGEQRHSCLAWLNGRIYYVAFVDREEGPASSV